MTIERATERLQELYAIAVQNKAIKNPVAWALYQTWRAADRSRKGTKPRGQVALISKTIDGVNTQLVIADE